MPGKINVTCPSCGKGFGLTPPSNPQPITDNSDRAADALRLQNEAQIAKDERTRAIADRDRVQNELDGAMAKIESLEAQVDDLSKPDPLEDDAEDDADTNPDDDD